MPSSLSFEDDGADATLATSNVEAGAGATNDASTVVDGTLAPPAVVDAAVVDSGGPGLDAGVRDAEPAEDARACLLSNAPQNAGCCFGVLPCIGLACDNCTSCVAKACHTNQFCCAQLNGQGVYQGVECSGDGKKCP
jgi:hypothetical protein